MHGLKLFVAAAILFNASVEAKAADITLEGPRSVPRFDVTEFALRLAHPPAENPFTDAQVRGEFTQEGKKPISVAGFADSGDGSLFLVRFCPHATANYGWRISFRWGDIQKEFTGELRAEPSSRPGPVIVDPERPKHFAYAGDGKPFHHLGYTAYHLLDPTNDIATIERTIDYCAENGFNKIRFLLTGYPRDLDQRTSADVEHGVPDPWKRKNYGSKPGEVNVLSAWAGEPHRYDFTRFNIDHWQRADHAVRHMRKRGIIATCIFIIEKQDLPKELGRLSEDEIRLYRYGVARLAAFDNVWWDLGNEHNEVRDADWGDRMGAIIEDADPYGRLASAHGYAEFLYPASRWADFIITQQYGEEKAVHDWALKYRSVPKPYVNEEYGYEGQLKKPGHGQDADIVRRCHWAIAMAGGYATYGDWSGGTSYFYMGEPGPGKAAVQLKHLRAFFEGLPFRDLAPSDRLASAGFCLAKPPEHHILWLPRGGEAELDLQGPEGTRFSAQWFDPRTGKWGEPFSILPGKCHVRAPGEEDWALHVR